MRTNFERSADERPAEQCFLHALARGARAAQRLAAARRDANRIRALIALGALAIEQSLLDHPPDHLGQSRAIDARDVHEVGLTHALVLLDGGKHGVLLFGQIARAGFLREQIVRVLHAAAEKMRGSLGKVKATIGLLLTFRCHLVPQDKCA